METGETAGNKRPVIVISLITAVCLLGDSMLYVVLPIRWQDFGLASLWEVGILLSVNRLVRLPLNPLIGWLYRRMSKRAGILLAVALAAATTMSYGMAGSFWLLLLMRSVWGLAWSFLRLGGYFTIIELSDRTNRGQFMGTFNGLTGIGSLVGMLAGSFAVEWFGIRNVTLVFGLAALAAIPFVIKYVSADQTETEQGASDGSDRSTAVKPWREPVIVWTLVSGLLTAMVFQGMFNSTLSRLIQVHESTYVQLWTLSIGAASLAGILQALRWGSQPWLSPWIGRRFDAAGNPNRLFVIVLAAASCLLAVAPLHMSFAVWILVLLGLQLVITAVSTIIDALATHASSRGSKLAVMTGYTVATDLGASLGPTIAYTLDEAVGTSSIYWCAAVVTLLLAGRWMAPFREPRRADERT